MRPDVQNNRSSPAAACPAPGGILTWRRFSHAARLGFIANVSIGLVSFSSCAASFQHDTPVTPGASAEARGLLAFLADNYGQRIISGQQDGWVRRGGESFELNYIFRTTGKYPALRSFELGNVTMRPDPSAELNVTRLAREWYGRSNGLVSFCWHWPAPNGSGMFYSKETRFELEKALIPGTMENGALLRDLDFAANQLKILRDAKIPVLWRPLHEMNGRWFWWGDHGSKAFRQLWQLMYQEFTVRHALTNLLWVFSPGASVDLSDWYPGDAYVDVIGYDHYTMKPTLDPAKDVFDELDALVANRKMLAMSEDGQLPDLDRVFNENAVWSYFTTWSGEMVRMTPTNQLAAIYNDKRVLTLDELPDLKKYPFRSAGMVTKLAIIAPRQIPLGGFASRGVTVMTQDRDGFTVRENGRTVTLAAAGQTWTSRTINGIALFADVRFDQATEKVVLTASSKGLPDAAGETIQAGPGNGVVLESRVDGLIRTIDDLRGVDSKRQPPVTSEILATEFRIPHQSRTNYSARIHGWLIAPATGKYEFTLISDGVSELRLGVAGESETRSLAEILPQTPYAKWPHSHEVQSAPVSLEAGKRYRIEVLHVQQAGSSGLTVRWRKPGDSASEIIPAAQLASEPLDISGGESSQLRAKGGTGS